MMTKYEQFLSVNRPAEFQVPAKWLNKAMKKCNFYFEDKSGIFSQPTRVLRDEHGNAVDIPKGQRLRGVYTTDTKTSGVVIYRPQIYSSCSTYWAGEKGVDILKTLAGELGAIAPELVVSLPERVVELPLPSWFEFVDDERGYVKPLLMFESEARNALDVYITKAQATFDMVAQ